MKEINEIEIKIESVLDGLLEVTGHAAHYRTNSEKIESVCYDIMHNCRIILGEEI